MGNYSNSVPVSEFLHRKTLEKIRLELIEIFRESSNMFMFVSHRMPLQQRSPRWGPARNPIFMQIKDSLREELGERV